MARNALKRRHGRCNRNGAQGLPVKRTVLQA